MGWVGDGAVGWGDCEQMTGDHEVVIDSHHARGEVEVFGKFWNIVGLDKAGC